MQVCQYEATINGNAHKCKREATHGSFCILHNPDSAKDGRQFQNALNTTLADINSPELDLAGVIFPSATINLSNIEIKKIVCFDGTQSHGHLYFDNTTFYEECSFQDAKFNYAYFKGARFEKGASFKGTISTGILSFAGAIFNGSFDGSRGNWNSADFKNTTFNGNVNFSSRTFNGTADFELTKFYAELNFLNSKFNSKIIFKSTFLGGATDFNWQLAPNYIQFHSVTFKGKCSFRKNETKKESIEFYNCDLENLLVKEVYDAAHDVNFYECIWPKRKYFNLLSGRHIIADEKMNSPVPELIPIYRKLHSYFYNCSDFDLAHDFYVGFMVLRRKREKTRFLYWLVNIIYSIFSRYGTSLRRPIWALIIMWLTVPIILLQMGIQFDANDQALTTQPIMDGYTPILLTLAYWKTFLLNASLSTLYRTIESRSSLITFQHAIIFLETLLNALFISLIAVCIRIHFAPKKPLPIESVNK